MVPSFVVFLAAVSIFSISLAFHHKMRVFTKNKEYEKAVAHALFSIIFAVISGAVLAGSYIMYAAEHILK